MTASRAYDAAFHAVSALFAAEGTFFRKHSAVEAAVHRDLVRQGRFSQDLGRDYDELVRWRETGDYGGGLHVTGEEARASLDAARRVLDAVAREHPELPEGR